MGIFDDAQTLYGNPAKTFPLLRSLRTQVLRINLYWGGRLGAEPPKLVAPRFDDPALYEVAGEPSTGVSSLGRQLGAPAAGHRFSYAVLQSWDKDKISGLKAASPGLNALAIKDMAASFSPATTDGKDNELLPAGVGYAGASTDHTDWFLTDPSGDRLESCAQSGRWLMDVGNPDYQAAWLANVGEDLKDHGWNGVLIDGASWSASSELCGRTIAKYPSDADYTAAVNSFLARVAPALRARGFTVVASMRVPATSDGQALWAKWLSYLSGGALAGWTKSGEAQVGSTAWEFQQQLLNVTEATGKPFLALTAGGERDARSIRFAKASFLLGRSAGKSAFLYSPTGETDGWSPETAVEVGKPLGAPRRVGSAWQRDFSEGTVLVNPSDAATTIKLDNTYFTPAGEAVTSVLLAPASGIVLRFPDLVGGNDTAVARRRPRNAADPADQAYDWSIYDRTVTAAAQHGIQVVFSILGTPPWANNGLGLRFAPADPAELASFAYAAAKRYSGTYRGPDGKRLPAVRLWLAWNEPNNPVFLQPQYKRVGGKWVVQSARDYTAICEAIYRGVHTTLLRGEKVGCGATAPRGSNAPASKRPSVTPLMFLRELKRAGLKHFDAYAHHPYYNLPNESPHSQPNDWGAIELGNIDKLIGKLTKLYGPKRLWITEYGYQTNDPKFGVSWARQARYLREAYSIARKTHRVDMLVWFLLRDDARIKAGWQSGFFTAKGKRKPAANAFKQLPR